ncbi:LIM domain only protein 7-like isoform X12 [Acanthaster planci]|uniref:LIM domain only protein 7-like isoform X12 n=1 Tax=Acanthaster planci TaxID=133434 RepID=A0A8B7XFJ2_ACAPL|nr:LIM domain only protein 7-like isoform X12 [Acanthaster planci]
MMDGDSDSERSASLRHQDQTSLEDALVEARKWIENVTRKKFQSDDFRRSMTDGILLCMLMQKIRPGLIKKINQSRSIYAGVDNLNVFLGACEDLGLKAAQLFHPGDLQDLSSRASLSVHDRRKEEERRLKSVCITIFWLGRTANQLDTFTGPQLNLDAFAPLIHGSSSLVKGLSPDNASSGVSSWASGGSLNNNLRTSLGYNDDVFTSDGIDLTAIAPEKYSEPKWKRDLKKELDSSVPGLSEYADHANSRPILRMDTSRRRPPPVAAKPLHSRSKSMPERSTLERQNSVEDEDSQSYRSGSSGDPTSPTTYDEFVKSKGLVQEDQEMWMSMADAGSTVLSVQRSLDSWKSRRRRATHSALERKASREEVEQQELSKQRRRSKTYQEMMEEKEKREKILMKMASKNKSLDAEDIVHILTKPALYEEEIRDVPERRTRSKSIPGNFKQGESMPSMFDATNPTYSVDSTDAPSLSRQPPPDVFPKPKVRRSGVGSAFAPYQRTNSRESNKGSRTVLSSQRVDDFTNLRPGHVEPMTFREKLLRDREREIGLSAVQRDSKSSARLPQKKRLSLGIMGRVAAFNKGETEVETQPKLQPPRPAPKPEPEYMALTINMKQKPRNENGFGFTIFGGADSKRPIVVTSITPGSTADKNELRVGDEIIAINGETTKMVTYDHALYCFSSSVLDGELTLKVHRYEDLGKRVRSTSGTRSTEHTTAKSDTSEFAKRRAFSQPSDPKNLSQAARARKILQQMRDEEQRMEDLRWEREEERMGATVNGNQNWNHSDNKQGPLRAYYDEPEEIESDGDMFSSEDDERMEEEIMNKMQEEQRAEEEAEARHRRIEEDEQDKLPVEEDFITSRSKLTEEAPISKQQHTSEESAPPLLPWQRSGDSGKMPKFQPVKFSAGPRPFSNRQGPEPYKPPSFKPVSVKDSAPDVKQDMLKRRSDFFSKPPEIGLLPVFGYSDDERDRDNRSGTSSPVIGASVTAEVQEPTEALIELQAQEPVESVAKPPPKQPLSLASRKAFNVEEERKRLERWHAEQERIRQEQYEQEQRRLREQQEKDLERAESEERRRKMEEQQKLIEKQQILQEQAAEEKRRLEEERKERVKKEQEYLERARLEREAAERERLKDEEEQRKMAAERKRREEERLRKEEEERQRKGAERRKAEEEEQRQREEEERHQRELEQLEQEAEERRIAINKLREKEAEERARRKKEEEARLAREQQEKEKERFARLREEEIERIRREEREKLRKEWEELQREKAKQEERERAERERLEQLRAEQERLRQERIKLEKQQEEERLQLLREKERLLEQSTSTKLDADKIPYNKQDRDRGSKSPDVIGKNNRSEEHEVPVKEEIIVSQEETDVHSAPPSKPHDSFKVPGQGYMSQFKDGRMATQHWMVEEAERRRLAEKTGTTRLHDPVEVHNDPILRKDLDMEPVLEKKNYAPEHVAPVRHMDKPANQEPVGKTRDHNRQPPPSSQNSQNQTYRELAVDVPPDFQPAPRRLRAPEIDAEKKKKIQNRQSMPDMGNRVPDVVRNDAYTPPPPQTSDRNSGRMPDNFLQQPQLGPPGRTSAFQQPSKKPAPGRSVSGKVTCSNCNKSLGRGAAMIIESLGLHFHIECFRCCVCNIQLGNGTQGTDVRIRASKLHCQNCYSNDAGFEFTEV